MPKAVPCKHANKYRAVADSLSYFQGALIDFGMRWEVLLVAPPSQMFLGALLWGEAVLEGMEVEQVVSNPVTATCPVPFEV